MAGRGESIQHLLDVLLHPVVVPIHAVTPDVALLRNEPACLSDRTMQSAPSNVGSKCNPMAAFGGLKGGRNAYYQIEWHDVSWTVVRRRPLRDCQKGIGWTGYRETHASQPRCQHHVEQAAAGHHKTVVYPQSVLP